jgi:hypothetical protein
MNRWVQLSFELEFTMQSCATDDAPAGHHGSSKLAGSERGGNGPLETTAVEGPADLRQRRRTEGRSRNVRRPSTLHLAPGNGRGEH